MLGASNEYTSTIQGLKPDAKKHQTYVDVQQLTGTPLQGGKRVQFNMFLKTINRITITENLTTALMPAIWIDEFKNYKWTKRAEELKALFATERYQNKCMLDTTGRNRRTEGQGVVASVAATAAHSPSQVGEFGTKVNGEAEDKGYIAGLSLRQIVYAATSKAAVVPAFQDFADVDIEKELSSSIVKKPTSNCFGQTVSNNNHREINRYLWYNHPIPQDKCNYNNTVEHAENFKAETSIFLNEKNHGEKLFQHDQLRISDELESIEYAHNFKNKYLEANRRVLKGGYSFQSDKNSSNQTAMNSSQPAQAAPGNRITFTSQTLPNGTINIGSGHPGAGSTIISTSQLPNTTTIKTITAGTGQPHHGLPQQVQVQHHQVLQTAGGPGTQPGAQQQQQQQQSVGATQTQTLVIKSNHAVTLPAGLVSSAPGIVTMTKTIQQQGNQPILNSMIPASVVVGMRPPTAQQQPKNVQGNNLGRVVIGGPHMVGTRPQSPAITLSALTQGPTPALILKTENGFQLLRVGTATSGPVTQTIATNSTNPPQIRLQTVPSAVSRFTGPPLALRKTIVRSSTSSTSTTKTTHHHHQQQQQQQPQQQQHQQQATTTIKQIKQNSMANTSTANNIVVNSVSSTSSAGPAHVYTSQANISLQQQPTTTTNVVASMQQQQQPQQQFHQQTQHLQTQPQITQIQTIAAAQSTTQLQQQQQTNANIQNSNNVVSSTTPSNPVASSSSSSTPQQSTVAQGNTKEKCRKFLANLIDLSTREPKPVEKNVRSLIQELVNANVEPEDFCDRLEKLLNASPQPCLIGFLKKSLPLLRQALFTKELVIEGIKPPPQHAVTGLASIQQQYSKIQAQIRPISQNQTTTIGQTQVRMITQAARPISHTTITKQPAAGIRIQGPANGPRLLNTHLRGPVHQTNLPQPNTNSPQIQHGGPTHANIVQIRAPIATQMNRPTTVQIRTAKGKSSTTTAAGPGSGITHVKVGQTQIKAISSSTSASPATATQPPSLVAISNNVPTGSNISSSASILSTINSVASNSLGSAAGLPVPSLPTVQLPPSLLAQQQQQQLQGPLTITHNNSSAATAIEAGTKTENKPDIKLSCQLPASTTTASNKVPAKSSTASASKAAAKKKKEQADKDRDDVKLNNSTSASSAAAMSSFFQQPSISMSSYGDDDINDVAAMGGVNLAEETQRILGCTENIGTQIRSCKDEVFLHLPALQARIRAMVMERGLEEPSQDVAVLISHACQERLKNIVEKLAVIAEHRIDVIKLDPRYEVTKDVRGQIKFLEELDKAEQKRHEELEREMLLRAAKSRSKIEDPEQAKMKARAKEMQRAELEELRQRDANMTALQAIGPRKKLKLENDYTGSGAGGAIFNSIGATGSAPPALRPRIKRVNLRDMLFFMEQERETCRSQMLYKSYLK
uniref:TAFH domain-containing protein n=2 Tax=Glossina TaxID=7393 RepID=A0A1A9WIY5_9MUSC